MKPLRTNSFYQAAKDYLESDQLIQDSEIALNDWTTRFYAELYEHLKNRESININITGSVRNGKSTVNIALGVDVQYMMQKLNITQKPFKITNIARSQYELSKIFRNPNLNNLYIAIDEWDDLEATGENATVETALLKHMSKIQAARYIHRGYCSPDDQPDNQSHIILNVIERDKRNFRTLCRLYYRILRGTTWSEQLIGHVFINVEPVLRNWVTQNIEQLFYKQNKTRQESNKIQQWRKKDFYVEYMCRKFEKMDLVNEKGIFRMKELDYADIILEVIEDLKPLTALKGALTHRQIKSHFKTVCRKHRIPMSIIGDELVSSRAEAPLEYMKTYHEHIRKLRYLKNKLETATKTTDIQEEISILQEAIPKLDEIITAELNELNELKQLKLRYYDENEHN